MTKDQTVVGSVHGVFASLTPHNLRWKACHLSARHTQRAIIHVKLVNFFWATREKTADGARVTRYNIFLIFIDISLTHSLFVVMRTKRVGWAWEYTGCPDLLGSDGTHVCKIPWSRAHWKGCKACNVQATTSEFLRIDPLFVLNGRLQDGSWPQEAIEGVFNKTCAIAYPNFKFSFPIWMLGKAHHYLAALKSASTSNGKANGSGNGYTNERPWGEYFIPYFCAIYCIPSTSAVRTWHNIPNLPQI